MAAQQHGRAGRDSTAAATAAEPNSNAGAVLGSGFGAGMSPSTAGGGIIPSMYPTSGASLNSYGPGSNAPRSPLLLAAIQAQQALGADEGVAPAAPISASSQGPRVQVSLAQLVLGLADEQAKAGSESQARAVTSGSAIDPLMESAYSAIHGVQVPGYQAAAVRAGHEQYNTMLSTSSLAAPGASSQVSFKNMVQGGPSTEDMGNPIPGGRPGSQLTIGLPRPSSATAVATATAVAGRPASPVNNVGGGMGVAGSQPTSGDALPATAGAAGPAGAEPSAAHQQASERTGGLLATLAGTLSFRGPNPRGGGSRGQFTGLLLGLLSSQGGPDGLGLGLGSNHAVPPTPKLGSAAGGAPGPGSGPGSGQGQAGAAPRGQQQQQQQHQEEAAAQQLAYPAREWWASKWEACPAPPGGKETSTIRLVIRYGEVE